LNQNNEEDRSYQATANKDDEEGKIACPVDSIKKGFSLHLFLH
jgi:hypothetical protein